MANISIIGAGYVGLVTAACFAEEGHRVRCVEAIGKKVDDLRKGILPIDEPGLDRLWNKHLRSETLMVTGDYEEGLRDCEFIFICVGSPPLPDGRPDLSQVMTAARGIASHVRGNPIVVLKSTVPVGTASTVSDIFGTNGSAAPRIPTVSNPEFLREGMAVQDFRTPDRVILGAQDQAAARAVALIYEPWGCPILYCDNATAEMIKYTANAFLATKISFINEVANLCDGLGVDVDQVARGIGMDHRIGPHFLGAGLGWGGSCLPKDTRAMAAMGQDAHVPTPVLSGAIQVNDDQPDRLIAKLNASLRGLEGRTIAVLGLTFKSDTDDLRESPALRMVELLIYEGCTVRAHDPAVSRRGLTPVSGVIYCDDPYEACQNSDAVVLATTWKSLLSLDMRRVCDEMRGRLFLDARNALDPEYIRSCGLTYVGVGRNGGSRTVTVQPSGHESDARKSEIDKTASAVTVR